MRSLASATFFGLFASLLAFSPAAADGRWVVGEQVSTCPQGFTIRHSILPLERNFPGPKEALVIKGHAGSYNKGFLEYLKGNPMWGRAESGKYIGRLLDADESGGRAWQITDRGPTTSTREVLGSLVERINVVAVGDSRTLPMRQWIILPEYSGNTPYLVLDTKAKRELCVIVVWYNDPEQVRPDGLSSVRYAEYERSFNGE